MTDIKDIKKGDTVTLTITARVEETRPEDYGYGPAITIDPGPSYEYIEVDQKLIDAGNARVEVAAPPLPTEPGVYAPRNNLGRIAHSYLYFKGDDDRWKRYDGQAVMVDAAREAQYAHDYLGGLVLLGAVE